MMMIEKRTGVLILYARGENLEDGLSEREELCRTAKVC